MNNTNTIRCPNCGKLINVSEVLYHNIEKELRTSLEKENEKKVKELETKLRGEALKKVQKEMAENMKAMQDQLKEKSNQLKKMNKLRAQAEQLKREKNQMSEKLKSEYDEKVKKIAAQVTERIMKKANADMERRLGEKDLVIKRLEKLADEAKRKAVQVSVQTQGDVQEIIIERELMRMFPDDEVLEIRKGASGADSVHNVFHNGKQVARILYESKRTKQFSPTWIPKLKKDMVSEKANIGVIVTETMPEGPSGIIQMDGIWVCHFPDFNSLALIIREFVLRAYCMLSVNKRKNDKMELLYDYLTGDEFRMHIETIFRKFAEMKLQFDKEKGDFSKMFKKREELLNAMIKSTADICLSIKQITGKELPEESLPGLLTA